MSVEETTRIELRETGGKGTPERQSKPSEPASGPLLSKNGGPAAAENGGNLEKNGRYDKSRTFPKKRRTRVYQVLCLTILIILIIVLAISLSLTMQGSTRKRTKTKPSTDAPSTDQVNLEPTSIPTHHAVPEVILNIDSVLVSLSITFPLAEYKDVYSEHNSSEYQAMEKNFTRNIDGVLQSSEFSTVYNRTTIERIRSGSIIIDTTIHLNGIPPRLHGNLASLDVSQMEQFLGRRVQSRIQDGYPSDEIIIIQFNGANISLPSVSTIAPEIATPLIPNERCFQCRESRDCVPFSWVCDGDIDCKDGEDEQNCTCDTGFLCGNGLCVDSTYRCDGLPDCDGGEDEINCTCNRVTEFQCPFTQSCIPKISLCDFTPDCLHHEDESESVCHFDSFADTVNLSIGKTQVINLPIPLDNVGFLGPGAFGLWFFSSPEAPAEFLINVTITFNGSGSSFIKFGRGLNATREPMATFNQRDSVSPANLNPFYARSEDLWVVLYHSDVDVVEGSFSVTAVNATYCSEGEVACEYSPECIPADGRCDGHEDCSFTGEDETMCFHPLDPEEMGETSDDFSSSNSYISSAYFEN